MLVGSYSCLIILLLVVVVVPIVSSRKGSTVHVLLSRIVMQLSRKIQTSHDFYGII
jgi:hypothetical protein